MPFTSAGISTNVANDDQFDPLFMSPTNLMFSAAQDVVAHEIGHGIHVRPDPLGTRCR